MRPGPPRRSVKWDYHMDEVNAPNDRGPIDRSSAARRPLMVKIGLPVPFGKGAPRESHYQMAIKKTYALRLQLR